VSKRAVRVLLVLLLLVPLGAWTAALRSAGPGRGEQVVAQVLHGDEQVVQADRQPRSRIAIDRRDDLGRARSGLLSILAGALLLGLVWRRWGGDGRTIRCRRRGGAPAHASRAPPSLRTA
jgi:hypothetical protein